MGPVKRRLSVSAPSAARGKRCRTGGGASMDSHGQASPLIFSQTTATTPTTFDNVFSDEVVLRIFEHLRATDLVTAQMVNRRWARLATDQQLWKKLFLRKFVYPYLHAKHMPTLAGLNSLLGRSAALSNRAIAGLPRKYQRQYRIESVYDEEALLRGRALRRRTDRGARNGEQVSAESDADEELDEEEVRHDGLHWKSLYKVSTNWQKGNVAVSELYPKQLRPQPRWRQTMSTSEESSSEAESSPGPSTPLAHRPHGTPHPAEDVGSHRPDTIVQASSRFIFVATRSTPPGAPPSRNPSVQVFPAQFAGAESQLPLSIGSLVSNTVASSVSAPVTISDIRIDAAISTPKWSSGTLSTIAEERGKGKAKVTEVQAEDDSDLRLAVCYSTGHISIFKLSFSSTGRDVIPSMRYEEEAVFHPSVERHGSSTTIMSAFHSPLLVTCSEDFSMSIFRLRSLADTDDGLSSKTVIELVRDMRSFTSWWPACLSLCPIPVRSVPKRRRGSSAATPSRSRSRSSSRSRQRSTLHLITHRACQRFPLVAPAAPSQTSMSAGRGPAGARSHASRRGAVASGCAFRLSIAFSTPLYPSSWTVGLQELVIRMPSDDAQDWSPTISSRHATAVQSFFHTPIDNVGRRLFKGRPEFFKAPPLPWRTEGRYQGTRDLLAERTGNRVTSVSYDDPFIVLAREDNLLEVYEVSGTTKEVFSSASHRRTATTTPSTGSQLRLTHRKLLHGHTGAVDCVAMEEGRCVSGGADGCLMVWDLSERQNADQEEEEVEEDEEERRRWRAPSLSVFEEEEEDRRAAERSDDVRHVVTLRTPTNASGGELAGAAGDVSGPPSLRDLFRHDDKPQRVRWLQTGFDKIVSVSSDRTDYSPGQDGKPAREYVHVWSFAS